MARPRRGWAHPVLPVLVPLGVALLAGGPWVASPATGQAPAAPTAAGEGEGAESADAQAIRESGRAVVDAYNRGDAPALAAFYTEDAEVFEADGARYHGRDLIERSYAELFAAGPGARLELDPKELRFLTPDVAKQEGRSVVMPASGPPLHRLYTAILVRQGGRWLLASLREEDDPLVGPKDRLDELDWMVGDWVDEGPESEVRVTCRRSDDGAFLLRDFTLTRGGSVVMTVTQRVGWDPIAGGFRSWEFDSEGGFGEGTWARDGGRWVISEVGVRPEGGVSSSTRVLEQLGPDQVRWTLSDRTIDGQEAAPEERSVLTRVPPAPALGDGGSSDAAPRDEPRDGPQSGGSPR